MIETRRGMHDEPDKGSATIGTALESAVRFLDPHTPSARADAEVLLGHVLDRPRHWPYAWGERPFPPSEYQRFQTLTRRRAGGVPVAYLTGRRAFWSLDLSVTPDVLIPRPETECLVEAALDGIPEAAGWRIADLGTGAGPVALALARERPGCQLIATDISERALAVARKNAKRNGIENVSFRQGNWLDAISSPALASAPGDAGDGRASFHLIVSNPPYVATGDPHLLQGDLRFEPALALVGGADGREAIARIVRDARPHLRPGGYLMLEHGHDQGRQARALLAESGYRAVETRRDYGGRDRVTLGACPAQDSFGCRYSRVLR